MQYELLSRLKDETAASHTRLENALDLMRADWSRNEYVALLEAFYGYVAPWEAEVAVRLHGAHAAFFESRCRAVLLARDIEWLTGDPARFVSIARTPELPPLEGIGQLFGSLYVMEGSTLGGRFIAPHVARVLELVPGEGNAYFEGYGARTGSMWNGFRETAASSVPADQFDAAVASATATFEGLHAWLTRAPVGMGVTA
jgi:heme oxygenase (biliverdin-IX-beta and delta-forming)